MRTDRATNAEVHRVRGEDGRLHWALWYSKRAVCGKLHYLTIRPTGDEAVCQACEEATR